MIQRLASIRHVALIASLSLVGSLVAPLPALAQYQGHNFRGDFGVNSGTQPPPGVFFSLPFGQWGVDSIKDAAGDPFLANRFKGFDLRLVPLTIVGVTPRKVLGANYGFMVAPTFSTVRPESVGEGEVDSSSWDFNDIYVVPVYLGWHLPRADFVAGYGFFAPTGRYTAGADDNVGLGMWSHELQAGTTLYLDEAKAFSLATTAYLEMHSNKKDQDLKVGNLLTLEGGAAYNVPKFGAAFGVAYYLQNKVSDDSGRDYPSTLLGLLNLRGRNRLFGIGPDITMGLFQRGSTIGALNVRYFWESAGKSSFQGSTLFVALTLGRLLP
jgi:hypothetical protein